MKNKILLLTTLILFVIQIKGQEYIPLAVDYAQWVILYDNIETPYPDEFYGYIISGDTSINGIDYKKVFKREFESLNGDYVPPLYISNEYYYAAVRDDFETMEVYAYMEDSGPCPQNEDFLLHDYSLSIGDNSNNYPFLCKVLYFDIVDIYYLELYGRNRKILQSLNYEYCNDYFIEGVGSQTGLFETPQCFEIELSLYQFCIGENCLNEILSSDNDYLPYQNQINIFPNPTNDFLNIDLTLSSTMSCNEYILKDLCGKTLKIDKILNSFSTIDLSKIQKGMYFLNLMFNNEVVQTQKIIKL